MGINYVSLSFELALLVWFFGCIVTYKIGNRVLVDGMGLRSAEFVMLLLYGASIASYLLFPSVGRFVVLGVLAFWFLVQFFCHWYYTLFGASPKKINGYNACFKNTIHLFPQKEDRIVPDFYHIVLHSLILTNIVLSAALG